jgi:hypothetical protein
LEGAGLGMAVLNSAFIHEEAVDALKGRPGSIFAVE